MESMDLLFGLIGVGMGLYVLYATIMMQKTGEINQSLLLDKNTNPNLCKNKEAYINKVKPCMWVLGISALLYGAIMLINAYVVAIPNISLAAIGVFFIIIIWFAVVTMKAKKEFF